MIISILTILMEIEDQGQVTSVTDKFKDLTVSTETEKVSDSPLTIPQHVRPPRDLLKTEMSLIELLSQRKAIGIDTITSSMGSGTHIRTIAFSQDYILTHLGDQIATAARFFSGWRCETIKVEVEMTSMYQQQGCAMGILTNAPSPLYNDIGRGTSIINACKYPRKFMPFGNNAFYEFELGWNSILKFWPLISKNPEGNSRAMSNHNSYMDNGRIVFRIFDPLRIATGVTDYVQLRFWVSIGGLRLGVYSPNNLL